VHGKFILRNHRIQVALVIASALVMGCGVPKENAKSACQMPVEYAMPQFAEGFRWKFLPASKAEQPRTCLELFDVNFETVESTVYRDSMALSLDPCPKGNAVVLRAASQGLATLSTTHVALLQAWDDSLAHWAGGAFVNYIQSEVAQRRLAQQQAVNFGGNPEWDLEMLIAHPPSALCIYPFGNPIDDASWSEDVPIVPILEYLEPHPLGRAEWMRVFGWMVNEESGEKASKRFEQISSRYEALRTSPKDYPKLRIFTGSVEQGEWHAPGGSSFIARLLNDAGVEYVFQEYEGRENVRIPLEEMMKVGNASDAWGLVVQHTGDSFGMQDLLAMEDRNRLIIPASNKVFAANTAQCDYFGWWVARPDVMLENVMCLFDGGPCDLEVEPCFSWLKE